MNVVEKFLEKFNQCIILLSGFEKLHLNEYAKNLAENFNFELIKFDYPDYDSLNKEINRKATRGLIVYGLIFEKDKLQFKPNYHISLSGPRGLIDDDSKYEIYTQSTKNCIINKFKNIKDLDYHDQIYEDIFNLCIDMIMKRVYGDRYEEVQKEYAKLNSEEKYDTPKDSEGKKDSAQKTEVSTGGRRNKNQSRVIGTRILMRRINI
jgi:hypothetical protein